MKEWNLISLAEARRLAIEALAAAPRQTEEVGLRQALGRIIDELPDVAGPSNAAQSLLRFARAAWDHGRTVDLEKAQQSFHHIHTPYMQ